MKWITRERPKIDRIACPWLIKNFVDAEAEFIYVPKEQVFTKAKELKAIPYDIPGAEYTMLPGQTHMVKASALAPALIEFFLGKREAVADFQHATAKA